MSAMVERMEPRRLLAGPAVVAMHLTGTEQEVTGVVLTFSDRLDPASAQNTRAYFLGRLKPGGEDLFWDPLNLSDPPKQTVRIRIQSALYDDDARTVTLRPAATFNLFDRFRRVRISGKGDTAVKDLAGVPLDGNRDGVPGDSKLLKMHVVAAKRVRYREADRDRVKLHLLGPGKIWAMIPTRREVAPIVFLNRTNALKSGLTGYVVPNRRHGDGIATIRQISGVAFASVPLLVNPSFRVEIVDP
jgi:hypothetical protein